MTCGEWLVEYGAMARMALEDNFGDIVGKAQRGLRLPISKLAREAGVSEGRLGELGMGVAGAGGGDGGSRHSEGGGGAPSRPGRARGQREGDVASP